MQSILEDLPVEDFPISLIESFTPSLRQKLESAGYDTFYKLVLASEDDLCNTKGIGKQTSLKIKDIVNFLIEHYEEEEEE